MTIFQSYTTGKNGGTKALAEDISSNIKHFLKHNYCAKFNHTKYWKLQGLSADGD